MGGEADADQADGNPHHKGGSLRLLHALDPPYSVRSSSASPISCKGRQKAVTERG
jgi:hypothetical protein